MSPSGDEYLGSDEDYFNDDGGDDHGDSVNSDNDLEFEDSNVGDECNSSRPTYQVITKGSLLAAQGEILQRVMDLLMVEVRHARTLLIHYQWDVDKLVTILVEKGQDHLFAEAGVKVAEYHNFDLNSSSSSSSSMIHCSVCMEDVWWHDTTQMDCEHSFCNNCWTEHFVHQIMEGNSRRIKCMEHKCNTICDEAVIRNLVSKRDETLAKKFDRFLLESYIEENRLVKWCPSVPHCGNAIRVESDVLCEVRCTCGLQFCFCCLTEAHSPCSCLMWDMWNNKLKQESLNMSWIKVNTKNCPTCLKPVEKNGGCNIVRCVCGSPFCWVCLQAKSYNHQCGRYVDPGSSFELEKKNLYRYVHYHDRFKAHRDSLKLETQLEEKVSEIISLSEKETGLQDYSWLKNGLLQLFKSRRVLSYSYAFAYYMFGDELFKDAMSQKDREIKQNLFEDQQQQFEANVEKLSRFIEEPIEKFSRDEVNAMQSKVMTLANIVGKLCKGMYSCIENDLLGPLHCKDHNIAPYKLYEIADAEKASEISASGTVPTDDEINRWMMEIDRLFCEKSKVCLTNVHKRPRE